MGNLNKSDSVKHYSQKFMSFKFLGVVMFMTLFILLFMMMQRNCQVTTIYVEASSDRRPFYLFAHMVNTIQEIDYYLSQGANAIEIDINFNGTTGHPTEMYHGPGNLCGRNSVRRENATKYINHLRNVTTPGDKIYQKNLYLLYVDCKLNGLKTPVLKTSAGRYFAELLIKDLYLNENKPKSVLKLIIAVSYGSHGSFVKEFVKTFKKANKTELLHRYIGWDFGTVHTMEQLHKAIINLGVFNIWLADGDYHCERPLKEPRTHLKKMVEIRERRDSLVSKTLQWTVDIESVIYNTLRYNVDSIMTNRPDTVVKLLKLPEFKELYRMATLVDDPWLKHISAGQQD